MLFRLMRARSSDGFRAHRRDARGAQSIIATLWRLWRQRSDDMQPPQGACSSWRALFAGMKKLRDNLVEHIHIENNILSPRFIG